MNWVSRFPPITFIYIMFQLSLFVIGSESVPVNIHKHRVRRIVNGEEADILHFPFQVQLILNGHFQCSGSVISRDWVLTAAHCLRHGLAKEYKVMTKSAYLFKKVPHKAKSYKMHENFDLKKAINDIGVLQVEEPFIFDNFTQPIQMIASNVELPDETPVTSSGWGLSTEDNGYIRSVLRKADMFIVSNKECKEKLTNWTILDSNICSGHTEVRKGPCGGDSGGPLITKNNTENILVGVVSFGEDCITSSYPVAYAKVSYYREWVKNNTGV